MSKVRWMRSLGWALVLLAGLQPAGFAQQGTNGPVGSPDAVPLYRDLGSHAWEITTSDSGSQAYFDQGLRLYYAFNHAEAVRSFRAAQRLDPTCAMCWWGEALAWGPNINLPMDEAAGLQAWAALQRAREVAAGVSERERAFIEALSTRYAADVPEDRGHLDEAYARAMAEVTNRYPEDREAAVLYAESEMTLRPWNYWAADSEPYPGIATALGYLERTLELNPNHPGACHFYIHAVEEPFPERAIPCADRLAALMPGAGHLVHMPGHIYIRVGRYADAIQANEHAVHADETYIRDQRPGVGVYTAGYYPHNYDFMAFAAAMAGRGEMAVTAADRVALLIPPEMLGAPEMVFLQHFSVRPLLMRVRFERWSEILASPAPSQELPHARGLWHYARGRALLAEGRSDEAQQALEELRAGVAGPDLQDLRLEFNSALDIQRIAAHVLAGRILAEEARWEEAVAELRAAAAIEDALFYGEPPEWTTPVRHDLGEVLFAAGRLSEAEQAFREDLERFPENGWALRGLEATLRAGGRGSEAEAVATRLRTAWEGADVSLGH